MNNKSRLLELERKVDTLERRLKCAEDCITSLRIALKMSGVVDSYYPRVELENRTVMTYKIKINITEEIDAIHQRLGIEWKESPSVPYKPATRELVAVKNKKKDKG